MTNFVYNDGGRKAAGFKGEAGDCVCRAIAIASGKPYREVYDRLAEGNSRERGRKRGRTARNGIITQRKWFRDYMAEMGAHWTPTMHIGSGCTMHLTPDEIPAGVIVVNLSRHLCAVIDGVIHDTHDPSREGTRCVYGYWTFPA